MFTDDLAAELKFRETEPASMDIAGHIGTLVEYGREVDTITEFGVCHGTSTCCWLAAKPKKIRCYDIAGDCLTSAYKEMFNGFAKENGIDFQFICGDSRVVEINETDLLFIDTDHTYEQLTAELNRHGGKAGKYIICHDTVFAPGCLKAIKDYIDRNPEWQIKEHFENNNGLTVLERIDIGNYQEKGSVGMETQERTGTPGIVIHSAMYGIGGDRSIDVTGVVADLVADGCDSVVASNDNFKDPSVGMRKELTVKYSVDGVGHDETVAENETITFAPTEPAETDTGPDGPETPEGIPLADMEYADLQAECKGAGLPANGSKAELIERLTPADTQE